jgi:hypothetical protein
MQACSLDRLPLDHGTEIVQHVAHDVHRLAQLRRKARPEKTQAVNAAIRQQEAAWLTPRRLFCFVVSTWWKRGLAWKIH